MVKKVSKKKPSRTRTPPFPAYPEWSSAKFWGFIRSAIRNKFTRWPPKYEALNDVKRNVPKDKAVRHRYEYQCAECKDWHKQRNVEVDHITPAGSLKDFKDLAGFVERVFCSKEGLQVLCKPCHKQKTAEERKKRNEKA